jgi:hypothetical protein
LSIKSVGTTVIRLVLPVLLVVPLIGCGDDNTTVVLADCRLERLDLTGTWDITFVPASSFLFNCDNPANDNPPIPIIVDGTVFQFNDIAVFASADNVGFRFQDSSVPNFVIGNVEADSCLMLLSFLDVDDAQYLNCLGTFDRASGTMLGGCDSSTLVTDPFNPPLQLIDDCDIDTVLGISVTIF